jgi:hypothetical protein
MATLDPLAGGSHGKRDDGLCRIRPLFSCKKREILRRFPPFNDGTPAHDHLGDILVALDAERFQRCFVAWVAALTRAPEGVIAIDGKTSRRSGRKKDATPAIHMVSAFAARQRLVLGQVKVEEKSNEIIAIPKLPAYSDEGGHRFQFDRGHDSDLIAARLVSSRGPVLVMS